MPKRVLDVGNCAMDHGSIRTLIESNFDAEVVQSHGADGAVSQLAGSSFDLVLINRIFDQDGASGSQLIQRICADDRFQGVPIMLISNFPKHQDDAVQQGAVHGFGKSELDQSATLDKLRPYLE